MAEKISARTARAISEKNYEKETLFAARAPAFIEGKHFYIQIYFDFHGWLVLDLCEGDYNPELNHVASRYHCRIHPLQIGQLHELADLINEAANAAERKCNEITERKKAEEETPD